MLLCMAKRCGHVTCLIIGSNMKQVTSVELHETWSVRYCCVWIISLYWYIHIMIIYLSTYIYIESGLWIISMYLPYIIWFVSVLHLCLMLNLMRNCVRITHLADETKNVFWLTEELNNMYFMLVRCRTCKRACQSRRSTTESNIDQKWSETLHFFASKANELQILTHVQSKSRNQHNYSNVFLYATQNQPKLYPIFTISVISWFWATERS